MLARASTLVRSIPRMTSLPVTRSMGGATPAHWKTDAEIDQINKTAMDFMPVPQGSWQDHYNKRNTKWNMMVAGSAVFLAVTIAAMHQFDCFYFHDQPDYKQINIDKY